MTSVRIGITGHQHRNGADWIWTRKALSSALARIEGAIEGWTSLAKGADQIFAQEVLRLDGKLVAVIPIEDYARYFHDADDGLEYKRLLGASTQSIQLDHEQPQTAFLLASKLIVDRTSRLFAVWDEEIARGKGGTADVVRYARSVGRSVTIFNPVSKYVL